jgi:hypothetical protein
MNVVHDGGPNGGSDSPPPNPKQQNTSFISSTNLLPFGNENTMVFKTLLHVNINCPTTDNSLFPIKAFIRVLLTDVNTEAEDYYAEKKKEVYLRLWEVAEDLKLPML